MVTANIVHLMYPGLARVAVFHARRRRHQHATEGHARRDDGQNGLRRAGGRRRPHVSDSPLRVPRRVQGARGVHEPQRQRGSKGMESRVLVLFLALALVVGSLTGCGRDRLVRADDIGPAARHRARRGAARDRAGAASTPRISRSESSRARSASRTSASTRSPARRFAYHVTEGFFVELAGGKANTELTSFERLSGAAQLLTDAEREYSYYNVSLGYNIFPGEHFIGRRRAMNTATYVIGGVGKTSFAGDDRFTVNFGIGMRLMPLDWLADSRRHSRPRFRHRFARAGEDVPQPRGAHRRHVLLLALGTRR